MQMLAEGPAEAAFMGAPLGIPMAAEGPRTRSSAKLELDQSDYLDNDAEEDQSLSSVSPRKGRKSSRKRSRVSRKKVKQELTENTTVGAATVTSMNGTIPAAPTPVYTSYPPEPQPLLPEAPGSSLTRPGPPGLPTMGQGLEPGILPFAEAVDPSAPSFAVQQGMCMQGPSWVPLPRKNEKLNMQGPTGTPEGPPTEAEVKALVACLIRRPVRALKLAPCLMEEVERVWWLAKQQQQQQHEGEQLQHHHRLKGPAQAENTQQRSDTNTKQDLAANTLEVMNCGPPTDSAEAPPAPTAAAPAGPACGSVGFATAEAYREEPDAAAAASVASSRSTAPLCTPASSDCGMPFQPLQPLQQHELQQQQLEQQQLQLQDMQEQQQQQQQQECHGAPSLNFDEPPMLQLDSSPNLAVTVEAGSQGPPPAPPGPPHLGWLDG